MEIKYKKYVIKKRQGKSRYCKNLKILNDEIFLLLQAYINIGFQQQGVRLKTNKNVKTVFVTVKNFQ